MYQYKPYKHRFSYPAQYDVTVIQNTVVITDLDNGGVSVTDDIINVIDDIHATHTDLTEKKVIYRDSDKVFDGIAVNTKGQFDYFYPIRETDLKKALAKVEKVAKNLRYHELLQYPEE